MTLFYIDLDGLKEINDNLGHQEGDFIIKETAVTLKETFRGSDIIGRLGGDEFVVLTLDAGESQREIMYHRLQTNMEKRNTKRSHPPRLSFSIGTAHYNPIADESFEELMTRADQIMYDQKMKKRGRGIIC